MKSKSMWKRRVPCGMGEVVSPQQVTYSVTFHQWLMRDVCSRRIFPTICVHMWRVERVGCHASGEESVGQPEDEEVDIDLESGREHGQGT